MKEGALIILAIVLIAVVAYFFSYSASGNAIFKFSKDRFCGRSSFAYCTSSEQCVPGGCGNQLCGATSEYKEPSEFCKTKSCYNAEKYNLECACYKRLCQWKNKTLN